MQNFPDARMRGQLTDVSDGENITSGGSSDSDANDWQVKPTGPSASSPVITTMPDTKCPSTVRITCRSTADGVLCSVELSMANPSRADPAGRRKPLLTLLA